MKILIVEDEQAMARGLKFNFEQEGYEVVHAADGQSGLDLFAEAEVPFDLVILDLMLPGMSGYETCRAIRSLDEQVPILVLTARSLSEDKILAFDCGTDQYMTKPFALPELLSRVRNLTSRRSPARGAASRARGGDRYEFGGAVVDFRKFQISVDGRTHDLTSREMQLLQYFIEHEGDVLPRAQILEDVWSEAPDVTARTIDNFVMRLRKLIEPDPTAPRHILSVRGTGYRFVARP